MTLSGRGGSGDDARLVGKVISGRYRIEALIAHTSTGALYRGEHVLMHKRIAVKVLGTAAAARQDSLARFEREAIAGAHVDHPNVAAAKDFGELDDGARFLVVEYLEGPTLRQELAAGPMTVERATRVVRQIALGLDAAHTKGIVHRAVRPENVYLVRRGGETDVVKIVDFGAAKLPPDLISAAPSAAAAGPADRIATPVAAGVAGPPYASPELAMDRAVDGRADLFALGVILYELCSGRAPALARGRPAPPLVAAAGPVPAALDGLARSLVADDPEARPHGALDVVAALDELGIGGRRGPMLSLADIASGETVLSQPGHALLPPPAGAPRGSAGAGGAPGGPTVVAARTSRIAPTDPVSSGYDLQPAGVAGGWSSLPRPIRLVTGGALATIAVVVAAIAVRAPIPDDASAADTSRPSATGGAATSTPTSAAAARAPASRAPGAGPSVKPAEKAPALHDDADAREVWKQLSKNIDSGRFKDAVVDLERLLKLDPNAPRDRDVRNAIVELAMRIMLVDGEWPDRLYDLITDEMDTVGIDILYELMTTRGGSRGAQRAEAMLKSDKIRAKGTDALRIAYDLRKAKTCEEKVALFERAKEEGDSRCYGALQMLNRSCRRRDVCCLHNDPRLKDTMEAIRVRIEGR